jgi:hypothetical protein
LFTIHETLDPDIVAEVVSYLNDNLRSKLEPDVSNYAKGRMRLWMPYEAPLSASRPWTHGVYDQRVWDWICKIFHLSNDWIPDLCLISLGGAISRHRDAAYAQFKSMSINLGPATFCYENLYPEFKWTPGVPESGEITKHVLHGGEVLSFNVKNPHWVQDVDPNRWGINAWRVSPKEIARFKAFKN